MDMPSLTIEDVKKSLGFRPDYILSQEETNYIILCHRIMGMASDYSINLLMAMLWDMDGFLEIDIGPAESMIATWLKINGVGDERLEEFIGLYY